MLQNTPIDHLIAKFRQAASLRELNEAHAVLAELDAVARHNRDALAWARYCRGILAFEEMRDWAVAESIFRALLDEPLIPDLEAGVLFALGRVYIVQGRWADAVATYDRLALFAQANKQPVDYIKAQRQIAATYCKGFIQGDYCEDVLQRGLDHCKIALDALDSLHDETPALRWLTGSLWNTLGALHTYLQHWDEAIHYYEKDLAIAHELGDRHGMGITLNNIAEIYHRRGGDIAATALPIYRQALDLLREFGNVYEEIDVLRNLGRLYVDLNQFGDARVSYDLAIARIEQLRTGVSSDAGRSGFFSTVVNTYGEMVELLLRCDETTLAFDMTERARSRTFVELLAGQASNIPSAKQTEKTTDLYAVTPLTHGEILNFLPTDTALLAYFDTGSALYLFLLTHKAMQVYPLNLTARQIEQAFDERGVLQRLTPGVDGALHKPWLLAQLYRHLIAPAADALANKHRLIILPHGPLHFVPFPALSHGDGSDSLPALLDEFEILTAPSATVLLTHCQRWPASLSNKTLALGFNGTDLHFAQVEASVVANQSKDRALIGAEATSTALQDNASNARWIHFSCHGEFNAHEPLASFLRLADGPLLAGDVLESLRLNAELVTLSACETGRSQVLRGEELMGLVRAFFYAGTPAVLVTLWPVDEASTVLLMARFYKNLRRGQSKAVALHGAQRYLRALSKAEAIAQLAALQGSDSEEIVTHESGATEDEAIYAHPYFWAPFVLVGDRIGGEDQAATKKSKKSRRT